MKKFSKWLFAFLMLPAMLLSGIVSLSTTSKTNASISANEVFDFVQVTDGNFYMTMTATGRNSSQALTKDVRNTKVTVGDKTLEYDFYCFQWRELEYLRFNFRAENLSFSPTTYKSIEFKVTNVQTENLQTSFGNGEEKVLYRGNLSDNNLVEFNYWYYIDSDANRTETSIRSRGNDFGIYKFDFSYVKDDEGNDVEVSIGEIYVAILPDDIDSIQHTDMRILYSISSSNKLMNIFNLYLSKDTYRYVNPKYIEWVVSGNDQMNANYVYSTAIRDEYDVEFANFRPIWDVPPQDNHGASFVFDSNDIEGTWTATCIIKNSDGTEKARLTVNDLSTIKVEQPSYVWLILLIVCLVILIGGGIALVVFYVKRDKIW